MVETDGPQMTLYYGTCAIAYRLTKAADTLSQYVIFIASPLQQWLHELASVLCYTRTVLPVLFSNYLEEFQASNC
jgi:hypothetical protein